jgi:hypothetical protein
MPNDAAATDAPPAAVAAGAEEPLVINLKNPWLAAFLAWAIPGSGHLYQGRYAKGLTFMVAILGSFLAGLVIGGNQDVGWGRVVYFTREHARPAFICQMFAGLAAMPAVYQYRLASQGKSPEDSPLKHFMWPPKATESQIIGDQKQSELDRLNFELNRYFELGTVYTMVAGLLNILVIFDAFAGPAPAVEDKPKPEENKTEKTGAKTKAGKGGAEDSDDEADDETEEESDKKSSAKDGASAGDRGKGAR